MKASNEMAMRDHATLLIRCFDVHGMTASAGLATCEVLDPRMSRRRPRSEFTASTRNWSCRPRGETADQSGSVRRRSMRAIPDCAPIPPPAKAPGGLFRFFSENQDCDSVESGDKSYDCHRICGPERYYHDARWEFCVPTPGLHGEATEGLSRCKRPSRQNTAPQEPRLLPRRNILAPSGIQARDWRTSSSTVRPPAFPSRQV